MNPKLKIAATLISTILLLTGCGEKKDNETALKNKRLSAVEKVSPKKQDPVKEKETIVESTNKLVEALKEQQEREAKQDPILEVDKEQAAAKAKAMEALITEIVHAGNTDIESQVAKRVGNREVWIDKENVQVIVGGIVCLREGPLEMFVTPMGAKQHETVLTTNCWASQIHLCLALCGVMPGKPVQFQPDYKPAFGPKIEIEIAWKEGDTIKRVRAQDMIREAKSQKKLATDWVFGGSIAAAGEGYYADGGPLICVSNFAVAMMDLPIKSGSNDFDLLYEANTEMIPDLDTPVFIYIKPQVEKSDLASEEEIAAEVKRLRAAAPLDK